jgi:hypothetical protein
MGSSGIASEVAFFVEVFAPPSSSMLDSEVLSVAAASRKYLRRDFVFLFLFLLRFPCSIAKVVKRRRRTAPLLRSAF